MGWPANLILVRHAESVGNVLGVDERARFETPTHDYGLTDRGKRQAQLTKEYIESELKIPFHVRYVSYYRRSRDTMEILLPNQRVYEDPRLAEAQRGIYHAMPSAEIVKRFPEEILRKDREGLYHYRPWGGENWPDVEMRIHSFLGTLNRDCGGQNVIIVVHGHWLLLFQKLIHHFSIETALKKYREGVFANASVTHYINRDDRLSLVSENVVPWLNKI